MQRTMMIHTNGPESGRIGTTAELPMIETTAAARESVIHDATQKKCLVSLVIERIVDRRCINHQSMIVRG